MRRILLLAGRKTRGRQKGDGDFKVFKKHGDAGIANTEIAVSVGRQENSVRALTGTVRNRTYSILCDSSLIKSVEFARRCNELGIEARVVPCLAIFQRIVPFFNLKMPIICPHFYVEALDRQYEISYFSNDEKPNVPKVLTRLGRFKVISSKSGYVKQDE